MVFWRLGYPSLLDPDEAHYGQLTREMLRAQSWMVPLLDGQPYIDKPVLFHWLQMLSLRLLGESELALRLPSALAALALIATVRWIGGELFDKTIGRWSALMFATLPATFALSSLGLIDMTYTAFLCGGLSCLLVATLRGRPWLEIPGYGLIVLAVMAKGPVALVLIVLFGLAAACAGGELRRLILRLHFVAGLSAVVLAASPWFVWMWFSYGDRFVHDYFVAGNVWYFTEPTEFSTRTTPYTFYLRAFAAGFFPWSLLAAGRALDAIRGRHHRLEMAVEEQLLWLWAIVVIGFFTAAQFRLDYYIFPAAPACCVLAAIGARRATAERGWARRAIVLIGVCFLAGGLIASVAVFQLGFNLSWAASALPIALIIGGSAMLAQAQLLRWRPSALLGTPVVTLLAVYATVVVVGLPVLEQSRPTATLGRWIARNAEKGTPIGLYRLEDWYASVRYYADAQVVRIESPEELRLFLAKWPRAFVILLRRDDLALKDHQTELAEVVGRPAIVGRTGRYLRRQVWGKLIVAKRRDQLRGPTGNKPRVPG